MNDDDKEEWEVEKNTKIKVHTRTFFHSLQWGFNI
jgi:hypothetical protein